MLKAQSTIGSSSINNFESDKNRFSTQKSTDQILEKGLISSIMATYSSSTRSSTASSTYLSGKYANEATSYQSSKSKTNSPVYQAQSNNGYQSYYANTATAATGAANSLLNGAVKVSVLSKNFFGKPFFFMLIK